MEFDIEIEDIRIRLFKNNSYSDRPTIIFLHDSLGCIELWRNYPKTLGEITQCNILIYDRQGYGKSGSFSSPNRNNNYLELEADLLEKIIEKCKIGNTILFGHSDGGSIALLAAAKYPKKILGIITEGAHIFVEEITLRGIREAVKAYKTTNLKDRLSKYHGDKIDFLFRAWTEPGFPITTEIGTLKFFCHKLNALHLLFRVRRMNSAAKNKLMLS